MSASVGKASDRLKHVLSAFFVCAAGAVAGVMATPNHAAAASHEATHWKCESAYECGPGTRECCRKGDGAGLYCSTTCDVVVT